MDGSKVLNISFRLLIFQFTCQCYQGSFCTYPWVLSLLTIYEEGLFCMDIHSLIRLKRSRHRSHTDGDHRYILLRRYGHHLKLQLFFDLNSPLVLFLGLFFLEFSMDDSIRLFQTFILLQKLVNYDKLAHIPHCLISDHMHIRDVDTSIYH